MKTHWRVALIQSDIMLGEPSQNQAHIAYKMKEAMQSEVKPDILLLPEMWNTGYALTSLHKLADLEGQRSRAWLSQFARKYGVHIVAGSIAQQRQDGRCFNTMFVFDHTGKEIGGYSKIHLFQLMQEHLYLTAGNQQLIYSLGGVPVGVAICYDIRFPEFIRKMAIQGIEVLFVSAQWPQARLHHWRSLLVARAIENQMYVVACNRSGTSGRGTKTENNGDGEYGGDETFAGHSLVVDPWGNVLAEGGEQEQIVTATLDLSLPRKVRDSIPVFKDRRPELY